MSNRNPGNRHTTFPIGSSIKLFRSHYCYFRYPRVMVYLMHPRKANTNLKEAVNENVRQIGSGSNTGGYNVGWSCIRIRSRGERYPPGTFCSRTSISPPGCPGTALCLPAFHGETKTSSHQAGFLSPPPARLVSSPLLAGKGD